MLTPILAQKLLAAQQNYDYSSFESRVNLTELLSTNRFHGLVRVGIVRMLACAKELDLLKVVEGVCATL